jgi:hypothetical protein
MDSLLGDAYQSNGGAGSPNTNERMRTEQVRGSW